jgi:diguanylate cyclase (GGDEF)-like protein
MTNHNPSESTHKNRRAFSLYTVVIVAFSLLAIVSTFLLANSELDVADKTRGFSVIVAAFLLICACSYFFQTRRRPNSRASDRISDPEIERGLASLDEAGGFFSGSLRPADTFRLVASRVRDLMPFKLMILYRLDATRTQLQVAGVDGHGAEEQRGRTIGFDDSLAGQCYLRKRVEIDRYMELDTAQAFTSAAAIPLRNGEEVFAVLQLFFGDDFDMDTADLSLLEAVGSRAAPLILGSIAFERSQVNALTDITTDLPNERAFYLLLEDQIAESQGKGDERPLTVLAIDIKNFDEINGRFGHVTGERVLNFVAQVARDNLRQMDFLARSINDEFLAVLPTATTEISKEIIARLHTGFLGRKLKISDDESIEVELNIGWATFGNDGETPGQLLSLAQLRKEQSKSTEPIKVLWFPQELVN